MDLAVVALRQVVQRLPYKKAVEGVVVVGFADLEESPYKLNVELLLALPAKASKVSKKALQDITWRIPR
jgi:hypothetical protein